MIHPGRLLSLIALAMLVIMPLAAYAGGDTATDRLIDALYGKGIISDAELGELGEAMDSSGEDAAARKLAGLLRDKGVIDDRAYAEVTGEYVDASGIAEAKSSDGLRDKSPTLEKALSSVENGFARLGGDTVTMKMSFFFQGGWMNDSAGFSYAAAPTGQYSATASNQFFMRRARVYLYGNVLEDIGYKVSFETASSSILRDAYVYLDYVPHARLTVGQYKVPFGMEGTAALASHPMVDRSMATNFIHAPTLRDQGVMLSGDYETEAGGLPLGVSYYAMVMNGNGFNNADDNDNKDVSVRLRVRPLVAGLAVGGSFYAGKTHHAPTGVAAFDSHRERWGMELSYEPKFAPGLKLDAEYIRDNQYFTNYAVKNVNSTSAPLPVLGRHAKGYGWYALAAYRLDGMNGAMSILNGLEPVVRYEFLDEDTAISDNERFRTTLGLNYYFAKQTRLMVNYELVRADGKLRAASLLRNHTTGHEILTTMMQLKF
jgi:phosphate-selective porin